MHELIHLTEDAKAFGPLYNISAFPFEIYLSQIKRLEQTPHLP